jgi:hypothetical protein
LIDLFPSGQYASMHWLLIGMLLVCAERVSANDSVMGGSGANLMPMQTHDVRMASEDISITYAASGLWEVDARYQFVNDSAKPLTLQLGFPEYRCDPNDGGDCVDPHTYQFQQMKTFVRDQPVPMRKGKVSRKHAWAGKLGNTWVFDVSFAAHEAVAVRHVYRVPGGAVIDGTQVFVYVTRTGALWAAPIGTAQFRISVPIRTTWFSGPEGVARASFDIVEVAGVKRAASVYVFRDWTPTGDLELAFREGHTSWLMDHWSEQADPAPHGPEHAGLPNSERCQGFFEYFGLGVERTRPPPAHPTESAVQAALHKGVNSRRICKNALFAMYGKRFQDEKLNRYFYGPKGFVPGEWPYDTFQPDPLFDPSLLTPEDWKALELMERLPASSPDRP